MRQLRLILLMFALVGLSGQVRAQTWTSVYDSNTATDFATTRSAVTAGSILVNGWTDVAGGIYSTASGNLTATSANTTGYLTNFLRRPLAENQTDQRVITTFTGNLPSEASHGICLRYQNATGNHYLLTVGSGGGGTEGYSLYTVVGGTVTVLKAETAFTSNASDTYSLEASAVGTSPTVLTLKVTDVTTSTLVATFTINDSTASLQASGAYALSQWAAASGRNVFTLNRAQTFNNTAGSAATGTISASARTSSSITPQLTGIAGGTAPYSTVFSSSTTTNGSYTQIGTAVTGANPVANASATGLSSATAYFFRAVVTDSNGTPIVTTLPTSTTGTSISTLSAGSFTASGSLTAGGSSQTITLTGTGTNWLTSNPTFTMTGITGKRIVSQSIASDTSATLVVNPGIAAGTLTVSDPSSSTTATIAVSAITSTGQVVFEGDSLTYGQNATSGAGTVAGTVYPAVVMNALGGLWTGVNLGVSGQTLTTMNTNAASRATAQFNGAKTYHIVVIMGGHNDIYNGGAAAPSAATVYSRLTSLCALWRAGGYKIVVNTIPPAAHSLYPSNFDALRDAYNALIRANWRSFADGLSDLGGDSVIGTNGAEYNTTYYSAADFTHMTDAGYSIYAQYVTPQVAALGNASVASSVAGTKRRVQ